MESMKKILLQVLVIILVVASVRYRDQVLSFAFPVISPVKTLLVGPDIKYPNGRTNLSSFSIVKGQWEIQDTAFVLVGVDKLAVYFEPDNSGRPISRLSISDRVRVVFKMPGWSFLAKPDLSDVIGWVQTDYLGFQYFFEKVTKWDYGSVGVRKNGYTAKYQIKPNGRFMMEWKAEGNGLKLKGDSYGVVYKFKDVFWLKKAKPVYWKDFFYQDEKELLYSEISFNPKHKKALLID